MYRHPINYCWRLLATGLSFILFGIGAMLTGTFFRLISFTTLNVATKRKWIKTTIQKGCLLYINTLRSLGVLSYDYVPAEVKNHSHGAVVIANHPTLLDAIFILALYKNLTCIVKGDLFHNPFTSSAVELAGYLPNDSEKLIDMATEKLMEGENILIFPEGTRNKFDDQLDFKRGAANLIILTNCAIIPILIQCSPRTLQKGAKWYNIPSKASHFSLHVNQPLHSEDYVDTSKPRTIQYRHLTQFLIHYYRNWFAELKAEKRH